MASNPALALTGDEWRAQFMNWIERGDPKSLLQANIFFDLRALWGNAELAVTLHRDVLANASINKRFLKQLSDNAREVEPPLNWLGNLSATDDVDGVAVIDLKRFGVRPFVDAARVLALANARPETSTIERLQALQVAARAKKRAFSGDHDAADIRIVFSSIECFNACRVYLGPQGIFELGIAQREDEGTALAGTFQRADHVSSPRASGSGQWRHGGAATGGGGNADRRKRSAC